VILHVGECFLVVIVRCHLLRWREQQSRFKTVSAAFAVDWRVVELILETEI
jgi:hypothetical protein